MDRVGQDATDNYDCFCCGHFCAVKTPLVSEPSQDDLLSSSPQAEGNVGYLLLWI